MLNLSEEQCEALLHLLWNSSLTGLALVAEDGTFMRANPAFCRLTEYTETELRKRKFPDITDPEDAQAQVEMVRMVTAGEIPSFDMSKRYITKTKRSLPALLRATSLVIKGKLIYLVFEIAPLDRPTPAPVNDEANARVKRRAFFEFLKVWWWPLIFIAGGILALIKGVTPIAPHE